MNNPNAPNKSAQRTGSAQARLLLAQRSRRAQAIAHLLLVTPLLHTMNTSKFHNAYEDCFELPGGYMAWFQFKTAGSIGFEIGHSPEHKHYDIHGTMQIHAPCIDFEERGVSGASILTRFQLAFMVRCDFADLPADQRHKRCFEIIRRFFDVLELTPEEREDYEGLIVLPNEVFGTGSMRGSTAYSPL